MSLRNTPLRNVSHLLASLRPSARSLLAVLLIVTVGPVAPLLAQVTAVSAQGAPQTLHITILDGEDAINNIRERTAREPIVQVEDENHKPVAGALLLFTIQGGPNGAGASFNGLNTLSVTTDAEGRAVAHGLKPNATEGSYSIAVSATVGTLVVTTIIKQANSAAGAGSGGGGGGAAPPPVVAPATTSAPSVGSKAASGIQHISRITSVLKSPWLFSVIGVAVVTVAVRTAVVAGHNPTSITAGAGTVGAP